MTNEMLEQLKIDVKELLDMTDTTMYDNRLGIIIHHASNQLESEGIKAPESAKDPLYFSYVTCIAYQVAMSIDIDVNFNNLHTLYITSVNELR